MKVKSNVDIDGTIVADKYDASTTFDIYVNGTRVAFINSSGDLHIKGDVILNSSSV